MSASPLARRLAWLALALVAVAALTVGALGDRGPSTNAERARHLASLVRCPTCRGQSALESDAAAARAIRTEIRRRVDEGQTDQEILGYLASRYGEEILLEPPASGIGAVVWALPAAVVVVAGAGLVVAFRRWGGAPPTSGPTDADRALVDTALATGRPGADGEEPGR